MSEVGDDGLTDAGRHVRGVVANGNEMVKPSTGYVPCGRVHIPERICMLPDGHPEYQDAMSLEVADHIDKTRQGIANATSALRGSMRNSAMRGRIVDLLNRIESELVAIEHRVRFESDPTVRIAQAVGRLRDRYKADGLPDGARVHADLTAALTFEVGPSPLAEHDQRVMKRMIAHIIEQRAEWQKMMSTADDLHFAGGSAHGAGPDGCADVMEDWLTVLAENPPPEVSRG